MINSLQSGGIYFHLLLKNFPSFHPSHLVDQRTAYNRNRPLALQQVAVNAWVLGIGMVAAMAAFVAEVVLTGRGKGTYNFYHT